MMIEMWIKNKLYERSMQSTIILHGHHKYPNPFVLNSFIDLLIFLSNPKNSFSISYGYACIRIIWTKNKILIDI